MKRKKLYEIKDDEGKASERIVKFAYIEEIRRNGKKYESYIYYDGSTGGGIISLKS